MAGTDTADGGAVGAADAPPALSNAATGPRRSYAPQLSNMSTTVLPALRSGVASFDSQYGARARTSFLRRARTTSRYSSMRSFGSEWGRHGLDILEDEAGYEDGELEGELDEADEAARAAADGKPVASTRLKFTVTGLILPLYLPHFFAAIAREFVSPVLPLFAAEDLGAGDSLIGATLAAVGLSKLLSNILSGRFISRCGARAGMICAFALQMVGALVSAVAPSVWVLLLGRLLIGAGMALMTISQQITVSGTVEVSSRGKAAAWYGGLNRLGGVVAPVLGGMAAEMLSSRAALALQAVWVALALVCIFVWFPRTPIGVRKKLAKAPSSAAASSAGAGGPAPSRSTSIASVAARAQASSNTVAPATSWSVAREYWRPLVTVGVFGSLLQFVREARPLVYPLAGASFGLTKSEIGVILSVAAVCDSCLFWLSGIIMDRYGRKVNGLLTPLLMGAGFFCIPFGSSAVAWFVLGVCLVGFGNSISSGLVFTLGSDHAPYPNGALFLGVFRMATDAGVLVGPLATGVITEVGSLSTAAWATTAMALAAAVWLIFLVEETLAEPQKCCARRRSASDGKTLESGASAASSGDVDGDTQSTQAGSSVSEHSVSVQIDPLPAATPGQGGSTAVSDAGVRARRRAQRSESGGSAASGHRAAGRNRPRAHFTRTGLIGRIAEEDGEWGACEVVAIAKSPDTLAAEAAAAARAAAASADLATAGAGAGTGIGAGAGAAPTAEATATGVSADGGAAPAPAMPPVHTQPSAVSVSDLVIAPPSGVSVEQTVAVAAAALPGQELVPVPASVPSGFVVQPAAAVGASLASASGSGSHADSTVNTGADVPAATATGGPPVRTQPSAVSVSDLVIAPPADAPTSKSVALAAAELPGIKLVPVPASVPDDFVVQPAAAVGAALAADNADAAVEPSAAAASVTGAPGALVVPTPQVAALHSLVTQQGEAMRAMQEQIQTLQSMLAQALQTSPTAPADTAVADAAAPEPVPAPAPSAVIAGSGTAAPEPAADAPPAADVGAAQPPSLPLGASASTVSSLPASAFGAAPASPPTQPQPSPVGDGAETAVAVGQAPHSAQRARAASAISGGSAVLRAGALAAGVPEAGDWGACEVAVRHKGESTVVVPVDAQTSTDGADGAGAQAAAPQAAPPAQ